MPNKRSSKPTQPKFLQRRTSTHPAAQHPVQPDMPVASEPTPAEACMSAQPESLQRLHAPQQQSVLRTVQQVRGNQHVQQLISTTPPVMRQAADPIGTATVTATVLNVRREPSRAAGRVGRLQRGQAVEVLAQQSEWLRIRFGAQVGYIHSGYATFNPRQARQPQSAGMLDQMGAAVDSGIKQAGTLLGKMWDSVTETAGELLGGSNDSHRPAQGTRQQSPATRSNGAAHGRQAHNPNAILGELETSGASAKTARQDGHKEGGVATSHKMAQHDFNAVNRYTEHFIAVGAETGLPPALLAAIASRESRGGTQLDSNGLGDHGKGFGLMQVDKGSHEHVGSAYSREHVAQAAGILKRFWAQVKAKFPQWTPAQQLRAAVAAYNFGVDDVRSLERLDIGTTGDDYSADVWARARYYAGLPAFSQGRDLVATTPSMPARRPARQPATPQGSVPAASAPVAGAETAQGELSGAAWVAQFPTSRSTGDLSATFQEGVNNFIAALRAAGAAVNISATYRPRERAYLMHYAFRIAKEGLDPAQVPAMAGVGIRWVHHDASGRPDLAASRAAARQMVQAYSIVYRPSLTSRHTERGAIDMTINWSGSLVIADGQGKRVTITSTPRNGAGNQDLWEVGASYGVRKLEGDAPHWSDNGR